AFTLVELVIAVVIVGILSGIAGPIYKNYALEAKRTEGYALLERILNEERKYYAEYEEFYCQSYSVTTCMDNILGIDARGNKYFTKFMINHNWLDGKVNLYAKVNSNNVGSIVLVYNITDAQGPVYRVEGL
ncbi:MAG: prepilin-type N-terminal cleavage/methylation domain-containing protein, partial [Elusimicrobia bacterium]|nr:prepilin-type N-terminal cleavage/methylation domain-containing protein [Elusimicrobiota bacterium]